MRIKCYSFCNFKLVNIEKIKLQHFMLKKFKIKFILTSLSETLDLKNLII